jgi:hypothetical protein
MINIKIKTVIDVFNKNKIDLMIFRFKFNKNVILKKTRIKMRNMKYKYI